MSNILGTWTIQPTNRCGSIWHRPWAIPTTLPSHWWFVARGFLKGEFQKISRIRERFQGHLKCVIVRSTITSEKKWQLIFTILNTLDLSQPSRLGSHAGEFDGRHPLPRSLQVCVSPSWLGHSTASKKKQKHPQYFVIFQFNHSHELLTLPNDKPQLRLNPCDT